MSREAFVRYLRDVDRGGANTSTHAYAWQLQTMTEHQINKLASVFEWNDPHRQTIRQALRWAKDATTQEVEDAIMEASR